MKEKRLAPTILHLVGDGTKVAAIPFASVAYIEDKEPTRIGTGRDHPFAVRGHDQVDAITHRERIDTLRLDQNRILGNQPFED